MAIEVESYLVQLDLTEVGERFETTTTITFTARRPHTFVELICEELLEATLDGDPLPRERFADERLHLDGLGGRHRLVVRSRMRYSHDGEGLHKFIDPADGSTYLCATSSVDNAKRWFACFDQPDLKASFELELSCPSEWTVVGNGVATALAPGRWRLAATPPISTYLVTLVAGPWHSVRGEHDGIPLGLHVRRSLAAELDRDAPDLFRLTSDALDAFHELFGLRYPFGDYHQAFVPEFNWGAMENPGCVTFRDQMIFRSKPTEAELLGRTTTIVHEMAHMWFGDLVTMRWWDDLWLNESFAEYLAHQVTSQITDLPAWESFAAARKGWGYAADRRATTHPVAGNGATDARAALNDFDGISYAKGASVLRQLSAYLGERVFVEGLRDHVRSHAYGNATFADLLGSWASAAGAGTPTSAELTQWAEQWLRTAGVDVITANVDSHGVQIQRQPPLFGPPAQRPHALTVAVLPSAGGSMPLTLDRDQVPVATGPVDAGQIVLPNAGDETWATIQLDSGHWARLPAVMTTLTDNAARAVLWNALRSAVPDGLVSPQLAVQIVIAGLPTELEVVRPQILRWITDSIPIFLAPGPARDSATADLTIAVHQLLVHALPGSSAQLTAARGWIALTDDVDTLRRWAQADHDLAGLVIDEELRWAILERRAALGDLSLEQIETAYADDHSASGLVHATRCRALRPDAKAKTAAWAELIDPATTLSQYQLNALAGGIWVAGQEQLTEPYAARWFVDLPAMSAFRSGYALTGIATLSFPALAVDPLTLERADTLKQRLELPAGLRRIASDGADELRRAIAVRASARPR